MAEQTLGPSADALRKRMADARSKNLLTTAAFFGEKLTCRPAPPRPAPPASPAAHPLIFAAPPPFAARPASADAARPPSCTPGASDADIFALAQVTPSPPPPVLSGHVSSFPPY